jgi:hypothetical protein
VYDTADGVPTIGMFNYGQEGNTRFGYRYTKFARILLHHACALFVHLGYKIFDGYNPAFPTMHDLYLEWQKGKVTPITRSILVKPQTFEGYMVTIRDDFFSSEGVTRGRFTIAHHKIRYTHMNRRSNAIVKLNINSRFAAFNNGNHSNHSVGKMWVVKLEDDTKQLLWDLTTEGLGGNMLPKREGQLFFEEVHMGQFHCGMRTLFACNTFGKYGVPEIAHMDGLTQLLKKGLEKGPDDEQEKKKKMVKDLVKKLAWEGMKECGLDHTNYIYTVACSLRQSRFCTYSKERTAPLLEMTTNQHKEIEKQGGVCVHAIVPLSKDGMFIRCFYNREDNDGTLIKIMPQSIQLFPSTVIMEYGRLKNVDGHCHLLLTILLFFSSKKVKRPSIKFT